MIQPTRRLVQMINMITVTKKQVKVIMINSFIVNKSSAFMRKQEFFTNN